MQYTGTFNFKKPDITDPVLISDLNENMDRIDEYLDDIYLLGYPHHTKVEGAWLYNIYPLAGLGMEPVADLAHVASQLVSLAENQDLQDIISDAQALSDLAEDSSSLTSLAENSDDILALTPLAPNVSDLNELAAVGYPLKVLGESDLYELEDYFDEIDAFFTSSNWSTPYGTCTGYVPKTVSHLTAYAAAIEDVANYLHDLCPYSQDLTTLAQNAEALNDFNDDVLESNNFTPSAIATGDVKLTGTQNYLKDLTLGTDPTNNMDVATKKYVDDSIDTAVNQILATPF